MPLPTPGGSKDKWGKMLNYFLTRSHTEDGDLLPEVVAEIRQGLADGADVTALQDQVNVSLNPDGSLIPTAVDPIIDDKLAEPGGVEEQIGVIDAVVDKLYTKTIDARDYLATDGTTDNTGTNAAALASAVSAGNASVEFPAGEYYFSTSGTALGFLGINNLQLNFLPGAVMTAPNAQTGVSITGLAPTYDVATVTANIAAAAISITVDDASGLSEGDDIVIRSETEVLAPDRGLQDTKAEWAQIAGISGTTITLAAPTRDSYDATGHVVRIDRYELIDNPSVRGADIVGGGGSGQTGISINRARNAEVSSVKVRDMATTGIVLRNVLGGSISDSSVQDANQTSLGYGYLILASERVTVSNSHGARNRHSFDLSGHGGLPANSGSREACSRYITFSGVSARNDLSTGISTHTADYVAILGSHTSGCGGGMTIRSRNTAVIGCDIDTVKHGTSQSGYHGLIVGTGDNADERTTPFAGYGLRIIANRINSGHEPSANDSSPIYVQGALEHAVIAQNILRDSANTNSTSPAIRVRGSINKNVVIEANIMEGTATYAIQFDPSNSGDAGQYHEHILIADNIARGYTDGLARLRVSGSNALSSNITIQGNHVGTATRIADMFFLDAARVTVTNNNAPGIVSLGSQLTVDGTRLTDRPIVKDNLLSDSLTAGFGIVGTAATIPVRGIYKRGDIVLNTAPSAAGSIGWVVTTAGAATSAAWGSTTAYTAGTWIRTSGGKAIVCTVAGTSSSSEPDPTTIGSTVTDGTVTWKYVSASVATIKTWGAITA